VGPASDGGGPLFLTLRKPLLHGQNLNRKGRKVFAKSAKKTSTAAGC